MKRIFGFLFAVAVCLSLMAIPAFAEEIVEAVDSEDGAEEEIWETPSFLGRMDEFFTKYRSDAITIAGYLIGAVAYSAYVVWQKLKNKDIKNDLKTVISNTGDVAVSQGGVVGAANGLIEGYNAASKKIEEFMQFYARFEEKESERDLLLSRLLVQNQTMMEIIQTAYANSQLPQGTKDLVIYKYAKCLALVDDEEKLAALMGAIHAELTPAVETEEYAAEVEEAQEVEA